MGSSSKSTREKKHQGGTELTSFRGRAEGTGVRAALPVMEAPASAISPLLSPPPTLPEGSGEGAEFSVKLTLFALPQ